MGDADPEYPTRTSPVTCGLAGLGGGQWLRVTGKGVGGRADGGGRAAGVCGGGGLGTAGGSWCGWRWTGGRGRRWGRG